MAGNILIAEDDIYIVEGIKELLSAEGYTVCSAATGMHALAEFERKHFDLIIMDVNLGEDNGFELCGKLRMTSRVPILFLTACNTEEEILKGFSIGGDDYLTKPFRASELVARIEALLRRSGYRDEKYYSSGDIRFYFDDNRLYLKDNDLFLSQNEIAVVKTLMNKWPEAAGRNELMKDIWGTDNVDACTLNVNIGRVREKIGKYGNEDYIETVRGIGYRWRLPVQK